jgi:uncharacterized protein DUF6011
VTAVINATSVACSRCGRTLTAVVSRERRIGPCCFEWEQRVKATLGKPDTAR